MRRIEGVWERRELKREFWAAIQGILQRQDKFPVQRSLVISPEPGLHILHPSAWAVGSGGLPPKSSGSR